MGRHGRNARVYPYDYGKLMKHVILDEIVEKRIDHELEYGSSYHYGVTLPASEWAALREELMDIAPDENHPIEPPNDLSVHGIDIAFQEGI